MYDEVTEKLEDFIDSPNSYTLVDSEKDWLRYLIEAFRSDYEAWERGEPKLVDYLQRFHRGRLTPRIFTFVGHAYLHIAYDLPRDIADSLSNNTPPYSKVDRHDTSIPQAIDLLRARGIYLAQAPTFLELMEKSARKMSITGVVGLLSKAIPARLGIFRVLGNWILALRNAAWIHGESLNQVSAYDRQQLEQRLLDAVHEAAKEVVGVKWNPFAWPSRLQSPALLLSLIVFIQATGVTSNPSLKKYLPIALLLLVAICYFLFLYKALIRYVDYLGEAVYVKTNEAMAHGKDKKMKQ
jgi:hypothetical protein